QIFERGTTGTSLTDVGEFLVRFSRELLDTRAEIIRTTQAIHQAGLEPFRLGFSSLASSRAFTEVCGTYRDLFPRGKIQPESIDTDRLVERIQRRNLDAAIVTLPVPVESFLVQPLSAEPLAVCLRKDDPLAAEETIAPNLLNGRLWAFSDPHVHPRAHE